MKRTGLVVMMMWVMGWTGISQAAWTLIDDFNTDLSKWTLDVNHATIEITTNPMTPGPAGTTVKLDMPSSDYKWTRMTLNNTPQRDTNDILEVAWDQGYQRTNWNGYGQGIGILDSAGNVILEAGHGGDPMGYKFYLGSESSPSGVGQGGGWYHYVLTMTATQSTLKVYSWISNNPTAYTLATPVWQATIATGIGAGGYSIRFSNCSMTGIAWGAVERDTMYVDNLYYQVSAAVPSDWTLVDDFNMDLGQWTLDISNAVINLVTNPLTPGPVGSAVMLDMPANDYKWARMTLNNTPQRGTHEFLKVTWDQGYTRTNWNGWDQGIGILDSAGNVVFTAGHAGAQMAATYNFFLGSESSPDGIGQSGGWYHYELQMTASKTTLLVYTWTSDNPSDYASATPVWQATIATGIGESGYQIRFANNSMVGIGWGAVERDTMYVDNLYYSNAAGLTLPTTAFTAPAIKAINPDGDLSDWTNASDWSLPFVRWVGTPLTSTTRAKFAYNDATDMLYVAFETTQANGGLAVVGLAKNKLSNPSDGADSTQLSFELKTDGTVNIRNEIASYGINVNCIKTGVTAGCKASGGVWTHEIAIPLWKVWTDASQGKETLAPGDTVYVYAIMQDMYNAPNGMDMTWYGDPEFYKHTFENHVATLTLAGPAATPGDANGDNKVDVSDLGILAANYGTTVGAIWSTGDFNHDGKVDVSDLGILAANYGTGNGAALDFNADAQAMGLTEEIKADATPVSSTLGCGSAGLPLIAGILLLGLLLCGLKMKE